jgi:hypothetical protein
LGILRIKRNLEFTLDNVVEWCRQKIAQADEIIRKGKKLRGVLVMAYSEELWREAKRKCRLNTEDLELAKRLGLNPKSLIKNIPSKSEPWKASVSVWLHEIDDKRKKKTDQKRHRAENNARQQN